jgi:hypothetical protein
MPASVLQLQFADRMVTYDTFLDDLADRLHARMNEARKYPEFISQRQAWKIFGRNNVTRWRNTGKIEPCKRPGKVEYCVAELQALQKVKQDYFG